MKAHPSESHIHLQNLKPEDIKNLVQQQGKARVGDKEIILHEPSIIDPKLKAIIYDPNLEIRSIGNQKKDGEMYFDLKADSKQVRIKVTCEKIERRKMNPQMTNAQKATLGKAKTPKAKTLKTAAQKAKAQKKK